MMYSITKITFLKVLTHKSSLFRIRFYTPKGPQNMYKIFSPKKTPWKMTENPSGLSPILAGSHLLSAPPALSAETTEGEKQGAR